ncbi:hypothetical protein COCOBI_04-1130 [Coccomyxa sp. Obi]|nr:hypothetical protein COCOBI_04-1130 [Coccomyxa sp. Obi]
MLSFIRGCMSPEVITALSSVAVRNLLPITCRRPLEGTLAAAFVLCQRASLAPSHVATKPEVLLAVLWILEHQHRSHLSTILRSYLDFVQMWPRQKLHNFQWWRDEMLKWQMIVLEKSSWRVHVEEGRDLAPVLRLMDGPDISPRIAALVASIQADASHRVIVHNRRIREASAAQCRVVQMPMSGHQHGQPAATAPTFKEQQQQQNASQLLLSRLRHLQQPATAAGLPSKHEHEGLHNNGRVPAQQAPGKHAFLEAAAAPPAAQATAEADADADADADVPAADLSYSLEHGCKLPRFAASSRTQYEQYDSAEMQPGHLRRRSDRLREAAVREADAAQRAGRFTQSSIAERHMSYQHALLTQQLQAEAARDSVKIRAVKRAR